MHRRRIFALTALLAIVLQLQSCMALVGAIGSLRRLVGGEKQEPMQKSDFIHSDLVEWNKARLAREKPGSEKTAFIGEENDYGYRDLLHIAKKNAEERKDRLSRKAEASTSTSLPQTAAGTADPSHPQAQASTARRPHLPIPHYKVTNVAHIESAKEYHPLKLGEVRDPQKGKEWATREYFRVHDRPPSPTQLRFDLLRNHNKAETLRKAASGLYSELFRSEGGHKETTALLKKTEDRFFNKKMEAFKGAEFVRQADRRQTKASYKELVDSAKEMPKVMGLLRIHERNVKRKYGDESASVQDHEAQARKRRRF